MKKLYYGAIALLALAGCTNDDFSVPEESIKSVTSINAIIEESAATRAYFEDEVTVKWDEWDRIGVYSDIQSEPSEFTYNSGETSGTFSGISVNYKKALYAYYPYNNISIDEKKPTLLHVHVDGNWGGSAWINQYEEVIKYTTDDSYSRGDSYAKAEKLFMVAKGNSKELTFKQTMGVLKFSLTGTKYIDRVEFWGNNREMLSGDAVIDMSSDEPVVKFDENNTIENGLKVNFWDYLNEEEATDFYFRVPAITFEKGFTFIIYYQDENGNIQTLEKVVNSPLTVKRGFLKAYAGLDADYELKELEEQRLEELRIQREALEAFYDALDGDNWDNNENWKTDAPLDQWAGVGTDRNGNVTGLYLQGQGLTGDMPSAIGNLEYLRWLYLNGNQITSIPEEIGHLQNLDVIELEGSPLGGTFPMVLFEIQNIGGIQLGNTQLTGSIPENIGDLTQLRYIVLEDNQMSGPIPESIGNLSLLEHIRFGNNNFEGELPASIFNLSNLTLLMLYNNKLTGTITRELQATPMWQHATQKDVAHQQDGYGISIEGAVMEIQLNKYNLTLLIGDEERLLVTAVLPEEAINKNVKWDINWMSDWDDPIFSVDENGKVTALREGEGNVRVYAADNNGADAYCHIRVVTELTTGEAEDFNGSYHDWDN